jgi:hypothetical protein
MEEEILRKLGFETTPDRSRFRGRVTFCGEPLLAHVSKSPDVVLLSSVLSWWRSLSHPSSFLSETQFVRKPTQHEQECSVGLHTDNVSDEKEDVCDGKRRQYQQALSCASLSEVHRNRESHNPMFTPYQFSELFCEPTTF